MQECHLDIKVLYVPPLQCCDVKECAELFQADCGGSGLVVVDTMALGIPLSHISYFVTYHISLVIPLSLTYQLALQRALSAWHLGVWDEHKHLQVFEALQFIVSSSYPVFSLWGGECFSPQRFIIRI